MSVINCSANGLGLEIEIVTLVVPWLIATGTAVDVLTR